VSKRTDSPGLGSLASAAFTAASTLIVTGFAGVVGVVIAHHFGRTEETDGFFAAYGVFIVVVLASQAIRVAVLPPLARAKQEGRLAGEVTGFAIALALAAVPLLLLGWLFAGEALTPRMAVAATVIIAAVALIVNYGAQESPTRVSVHTDEFPVATTDTA